MGGESRRQGLPDPGGARIGGPGGRPVTSRITTTPFSWRSWTTFLRPRRRAMTAIRMSRGSTLGRSGYGAKATRARSGRHGRHGAQAHRSAPQTFQAHPGRFNDNLTFRGKGLETMAYAKEQGLTLRDDSILCRPGQEAFYTHYYAGAFWPRLPIILESEHYGLSVQRGDWGDGSDYLRAVEAGHGSYISVHWWPQGVSGEEQATGRPHHAADGISPSTPGGVAAREAPRRQNDLSHRWRNNGVAPVLPAASSLSP